MELLNTEKNINSLRILLCSILVFCAVFYSQLNLIEISYKPEPGYNLPNQVLSKKNANPVVSVRPYGYRELKEDLDYLVKTYPQTKVQVIGNSYSGADIMAVKLGTGTREVFISGAWHGDEWITALLLSKLVENILINSADWQPLLDNFTIYIVPMVNPDGCEISVHQRDVNPYLQSRINILAPKGFDLAKWRANIMGVDLNKQYPVNWPALSRKLANNIPPRGTAGESPLSTMESKSIYDFTLKHNFSAVFAYHSQGEILYWNTLPGKETAQMKEAASIYAHHSGYRLVNDTKEFAGGYRDWFVLTYGRPGLTVEVGRGENPLPLGAFNSIWSLNYTALYQCLCSISKV